MKREIYAYRCRKCGALHYPFRMVCKNCRANDPFEFDPVPLPRKGTLLTFTRLSTLPGDFAVPEILLGIVELENGLRMTAQLDIPTPRAGMTVVGSVEPVRTHDYHKFYGMVFRAAS